MTQKNDYSYYDILEISPDSGPQEIKEAYERARRTFSKENPALYTMFNASEAQELARLVEEAYSVLSSPSLKIKYDQKIRNTDGVELDRPLQRDSKNEAPAFQVSVPPPPPQRPTGTPQIKKASYEKNETFETEISNQTVFDGAFLKKIREYKNLSTEEISRITKISNTYILAVEKNNYASLPAQVFVRGFIVQIAKVLALDEKKAADSYMKLYKEGFGK